MCIDYTTIKKKERRMRKEMERVGTIIIIQTARTLYIRRYRLLKSTLVDNAAIKLSRAAIHFMSIDIAITILSH